VIYSGIGDELMAVVASNVQAGREEDSWSPRLIRRLAQLDFGDLPLERRREVYGVQYAEIDDASGGRMWVTPHGWRHLHNLDPANWFVRDQYSQRGEALSGGTGAVFRVSTPGHQLRSIDFVVKFSRMAQRVSFHVSSEFPGSVPDDVIENATFNDPFQEFALLEEMRGSKFGPSDLRILTKRPLAIYSPARRFEAWQLGRAEDVFIRHRYRLENDQGSRVVEPSVDLSIERQYVVLFHWVRGIDAETLVRQGFISTDEARDLLKSVIDDLAAKGFRVLDMKLNHVILRYRPGRGLIRRGKRPIYAIVDFELLQRTESYQRWRSDRMRIDRRPQAAGLGNVPWSSAAADVNGVSVPS
jgi:hypothetical protein